MGIYIKGMEMPKDKPLIIKINPDGAVSSTFDNDYRKYEAFSVSSHSRLIDADALMLKILDYIEEYSELDEDGLHNFKWCAMKEVEMAINEADTIIGGEKHEA